MAWTEDRVEMLKKLWAEGLSASQIARQMGGITRNAVIGKVHRLGLSGRAKPARVSTAKVNSAPSQMRHRQNGGADGAHAASPMGSQMGDAHQNDAAFEQADEATLGEPSVATEERASVLNLTEHTCKWPVGDPGTQGFHFCGARSKPGNPYCEAHIRQAYQPTEQRRKQKLTP